MRLAVGEVFKSLILIYGSSIYEEIKAQLLSIIQSSFIREADKAEIDLGQQKNQEVYYDNPQTSAAVPISEPSKILHDTEGWKSLETSMKILQTIALAAGIKFFPYLDEELCTVIQRATQHLNRFVREIGFYFCETLFEISDLSTLKNISTLFVPIISKGLSDNWSQVRYAASKAVRAYFKIANESQEMKDLYNPKLLPMMCLNRYYLAEGVKLYSQETWKIVVGEKGKDLVGQYLPEFVGFYISQTKADNHAVREASCHSIGEICNKIAPLNRE